MRQATHPGEILVSRYIRPEALSPIALARLAGIDPEQIEELVAGRAGVTAELAGALSRCCRTTPGFWLDMQAAHDGQQRINEPH